MAKIRKLSAKRQLADAKIDLTDATTMYERITDERGPRRRYKALGRPGSSNAGARARINAAVELQRVMAERKRQVAVLEGKVAAGKKKSA